MLILGLQGSPRKKSNTRHLLSLLLEEAAGLGAETETIHVCERNVLPCEEYIVCEKKGFCPIKDDMKSEIYGLIRRAEIVVLASPVFFFNVTAQLKALIDRCQTFWARKYRLKLADPFQNRRKGFTLAVGATKGKNLFEGLDLTAKYFFDAISADYRGGLFYRGIESVGDMAGHPTVAEDVRKAASDLMAPFMKREKILFVCQNNEALGPAAEAFTQVLAGDRFDAISAGIHPGKQLDPVMKNAMAKRGIDLEFRMPRPVETAVSKMKPDRIVLLGSTPLPPGLPERKVEHWDIADPAGNSMEQMIPALSKIDDHVRNWTENYSSDQTE